MDRIDEWMSRAFEEENLPKAENSKIAQQPKEQFVKHAKRHGHKNARPQKNWRGKAQQGGRQAGQQTGQQIVPRTGTQQVIVQQTGTQRPPQKKRHGGHGKPFPPKRGHHARAAKSSRPTDTQARRIPQSKPKNAPILKGKLKIIPLGGLNEVGKNMMALEYEDDIIIIDMGFEFPSEDLFGIDYVIPDVSYLEENKKRIRGVIITHGHLDHIGGIPYILPKLDFPPVYSMKLTIGLISKKIEEFNISRMTKLISVNPGEVIRLGKFAVDFVRVAHSVPDATALLIDTPVGKLFHTGDFKFDPELAGHQAKEEIHRLEAIGHQNVLAMFGESTNALVPGHTVSEKQVGEALEQVIKEAKGRIIIASFSSIIGRMQQIIDHALKYKRKIFVSGRSMRDNIDIAAQLGFLKFPPHAIQDIRKYKKVPDEQTLILTTGSQGEAFSALTRISRGTHDHITIKPGDTIAMSSNPIPGNERAINSVINNLCMLGAKVIHNKIINDIHTSGHAKQDELIRMAQLIKPKYFIPVHGEYYMRQAHAQLVHEKCGIPEDHIIMLQNGDVLLVEPNRVYKSPEKIETKYILIDGRGEGQMDSPVQLDRAIMSRNGALVVLVYVNKKNKKLSKMPDVISRGFTYMHESEQITEEIINIAADAYKKIAHKNPGADRRDIKKYIKQTIDKYTDNTLERRPLIIPVIVEV